MDESVKTQIESLITKNRVMLFMKGSKSFPQCGFSSQVVGILKELGTPFETANVLSDPSLRDGIKIFSDWPTIPQLYVNGEFVGGCDIVREMHQTGELAKLLGVEVAPQSLGGTPPTIRMSERAASAFREAEEPGTTDVLRIEVDPAFRVDLFFGPPVKGDIQIVANGVKLALDAASAKRANGMSIDYVDGPDGAGFKIENPNAPKPPAPVKKLSAAAVRDLLAGSEKAYLFDVRTDAERAIAKIDAAIHLDAAGKAQLESLPKDALVVFHCHHGVRSLAAAEHYAREGFTRLHNLEGGIDAWSSIDPSVPRY
jgi:monothiol glutaredoxin